MAYVTFFLLLSLGLSVPTILQPETPTSLQTSLLLQHECVHHNTNCVQRPDAAILGRRASDLRKRIPAEVKISAVIKNVALPELYAQALADTGVVDVLAVASLFDALKLRDYGIVIPVMVLYPVAVSQVSTLAKREIEVPVESLEWLLAAVDDLRGQRLQHRLRLHLWIDTGMGRFGVTPDQVAPLASLLHSAQDVVQLVGVATHLCCMWWSGPHDDEFPRSFLQGFSTHAESMTRIQRSRFETVLGSLAKQGLRGPEVSAHVATSGAVQHEQRQLYYDMVRVGRLLLEDATDLTQGLGASHMVAVDVHQVHVVDLRVVLLKKLPEDQWCIGYGCVPLDTAQSIGLVPAGGRVVAVLSGPETCAIETSSVISFKGQRVPILLSHGSPMGIVVDVSVLAALPTLGAVMQLQPGIWCSSYTQPKHHKAPVCTALLDQSNEHERP